jgi:ATP-dependent DNA helicase 2 subunit 2
MKEAVVLILDANDSMNKAPSYDDDSLTTTTTTRFDCAKRVALDMISDLMIQSKTNEVAVLVLKTKTTRHHFCEHDLGSSTKDDDGDDDSSEIPFPNITEFGGDGETTGINRPTPELLRRLGKLRATPNSKKLRGDFCDGIIVAADALYRRTSGKKYQRRIVLITDAEHKVEVDHQQLLVVLDSLRAMECQLQVIGLEFEQQAEYQQAASACTAKEVRQEDNDEGAAPMEKEEEDEDSATDVSEEDDEASEEYEEDDNEHRLLIKRQNEKLLIGLTEKTGGFVMAAKELQPILQRVLGQRIPKSTRRKFLFQIAPGLVLDARFSLLLSKASAPSLIKRVVVVDDQDKIQDDALGEELTSAFQTIVSHWDPEHEAQEITEIAQAYRYGSDLVPMGGLDLSSLSTISPVKMTILGYMDLDQVPPELRIGPPYAISGADSQRTCAAICALARALRRQTQVGIATLVKSKDADPILVGLFPLEAGDSPTHLVFLQLPFQGDVPPFSLMEAFEPTEDTAKQTASDDLIDALMLPDKALDYTHIPNPYLRSFHQTVVQRVLNPECPVVSVRLEQDDPMATPDDVLERAKPALQTFRKQFPLTKVSNQNTAQNGTTGSKRRKGPATYRDFAEKDDD